jgi:YidC/Oxa1 family membrane protein insertase
LWQFVVNGFSELIQFCYQVTDLAGLANYGLAIILITVLIKLVLYPLTNTQMKSMKNMQEIQPKLKELQAKYKEQPEKLQSETMKLYKEKGVNPFGGCLPLLIQMPILIAFYQALIKFEYAVPAHAAFLWIPNISQPDPYYILPILTALTTYYQQRISTVDANDPTQKTMMMVMPLFIGWIALKFAAGLAIYWVMFNILNTLQQLYVNYKKNRTNLAVSGVGAGQVAVAESGRTSDGDDVIDTVPEAVREKGGNADAKPGKKRKKR